MSQRNAVQRAFDRFGAAAGFEKKSGSWYSRGDEVISILNLQKSQYGPKYFLNQSFWLRREGDEAFPPFNHGHVRARVGRLLPDQFERLERLLDLEYEMPDDERITELVSLLNKCLLPLIAQASSTDGLRALRDEGKLTHAGISGEALRAFADSEA